VAPVERVGEADEVADGPDRGAGPAPRRRRRGSPVTIADVVGAATALLEAGGWEALSMRAVCRHLDVSLPTAYAVARSRENVVELVGAAGLEAWVRAWAASADAFDAGAAAAADRPWLLDLVRLRPPTARAALARAPEAVVRRLASPSRSTAATDQAPDDVGDPGHSDLDRALAVWMALELAHRARAAGLSGAPVGTVASNVLRAVLGTVG
jgi:AcrR family transcriptional regulator